MMLCRCIAIILLAGVASCYVESAYSRYYEKLTLKPLTNNFLLASFQFQTLAPYDSQHGVASSNHFSFMPRSVGQIVRHTHTHELHLRLTQGRWDDENWGSLPYNGRYAGGTGLEVFAWLRGASDEIVTRRWTTLTNSLAGLFCASLNFLDSTRTIRPQDSFKLSPYHDEAVRNHLHLFHGSLPREPVCTENLTPFLKLLPCKRHAGVASLLNGHRLFDAQWQVMSIDMEPIVQDGVSYVQMSQKIDMVVDIPRSLRKIELPVPSLQTADLDDMDFDVNQGKSNCIPWTLSKIFGRPLNSRCSVASKQSLADVEIIHNPKDPSLNEYFLLRDGELFDYAYACDSSREMESQKSPVSIYRSLTGYGQEHGGFRTIFKNPSAHNNVKCVYLESLLWPIKPYIHTMKASISYKNHTIIEDMSVVKKINYRPAIDRKRGTYLEMQVEVPPASSVIITWDIEKAILRYDEYPPDANRGFDIAPAVITILDGNGDITYTLRTGSLLLSLPTPDFSMPYNVIILTSTIIALAFGTVFNLLTRRFIVLQPQNTEQEPRHPIIRKLLSVCNMVKAWIGSRR